MELDVDALPAAPVPVGPRVSNFPPVHMDAALLVPADEPEARVRGALAGGAGELLENLGLFDVYTGAQVPAGQKSLAYAFTFRAPDRTLTGEEARQAFEAAVAAAAATNGAVLRG
jgi:phenylalanyl-tRNA synthetase beta chain